MQQHSGILHSKFFTITKQILETFGPIIFIVIIGWPILVANEGWLNPDQSLYLKEGLLILKRQEYSYLLRPPLLPVILAFAFLLFGTSVAVAHFVIKLFFIGILIILYKLGEKIAGRITGWISVLLALGTTFLLRFSTYLMPDMVQAFFMLLGLLFLFYAFETQQSPTKYWILAGVSIAASFYVKQTGILWAIVPGIIFILVPQYWGKLYLRHIIIFWLLITTLLLIWWIYVYLETGQIYLLSTMDIRPPQSIVHASNTQEANFSIIWTKFSVIVFNIAKKSWLYITDKIYPNFELFPIFVWAWLYILVKAIQGNRSYLIILVAFATYFFPLLYFLGPRGGIDSVRNFLPVIFLSVSISARTVVDIWQFSIHLIIKMLGIKKNKLHIERYTMLLGIGIVGVFTITQNVAFLEDQLNSDINSLSWNGPWYNDLTQQTATWMNEHLPENAKIMTTWLWSNQLEFLTKARYHFYQFPIKKVKLSTDYIKPIFTQDGLWGSIDNTLRNRPSNMNSPLYLEKHRWADFYIALWEYDILQDIREHEIDYLIFTGETYLHPLHLLDYFRLTPGFTEIYSAEQQVNDVDYEIHIFKIDRDSLSYQGYPLNISPSTLNKIVTSLSNTPKTKSLTCFEKLNLIGQNGILIKPVRYSSGFLDDTTDIRLARQLIERCASQVIASDNLYLPSSYLLLGWNYFDQGKVLLSLQNFSSLNKFSQPETVKLITPLLYLVTQKFNLAQATLVNIRQKYPDSFYLLELHKLINKLKLAQDTTKSRNKSLQGKASSVPSNWLSRYLADIYFKMGKLAMEQNKLLMALTAYQQALNLVPDNQNIRLYLIKLYLIIGNQSFMYNQLSAKDITYKDIIDAYRQVLTLDPGNTDAQQALLQVYLAAPTPELAEETLLALQPALEPEQRAALLDFHRARQRSAREAQLVLWAADDGLRRQIAEAYQSLGQQYLELAQTEERPDLAAKAADAYQQAFALAPDDDSVRQAIVQVYAGYGAQVIPESLLDQVLLVYQAELAKKPKRPAPFWRLAQVYQKLGYTTEALAMYSQAAQTFPKRVDVHERLALAYLVAGQPEQAITAYERALALEPDRVDIYAALGELYRQQGQSEQAFNLYRQAAQQTPSAAWPHLELGKLYLAQAAENSR